MGIYENLKKEHESDSTKLDKGELITDTLLAQYRQYALQAVDFAKKQYNINLDFSENSIEIVEEILNKLSLSIPKSKPTADEIENMSKVFAGYIGEVIRNNWGGKYVRERESPITNNGVSFKINSSFYYIVSKVYRRLTNNEGDDIGFFFQTIKNDIKPSS
jgi:hypothetical protein